MKQIIRFFSPEKKKAGRNTVVPESEQREILHQAGLASFSKEFSESKIYRSPSPTKRKEVDHLSPVKERHKISYKSE